MFGHPFELLTDNQPLTTLLNECRATSAQASARIKRWSLLLGNYEYTIRFRKTQAHGNADALSRLPLPTAPAEVPMPAELVLLTEHLEDSPVTAQHIRLWTKRNPVLSVIQNYVRHGWPDKVDSKFTAFTMKREELSLHQDCMLWGNRVVIPNKGKEAVLHELHCGHPGITRMKALARTYVWWPGIDKDIENMVQTCNECQVNQATPPVAPLHPWKWPTKPWSRLHLDFAGPLQNKMFLILIDAHSKWVEAFPTNSSTSAVVIDRLRTVFTQFGLPEMVVTDNGTCFVSDEFEQFLQLNGVKHTTSAPYHPSSNGLAERAVQIVKKGLQKVTDGSVVTRLARILTSYRVTPQSTTGVSPAQLLLGHQPRTRLDMLRPDINSRVEDKQTQQIKDHDKASRDRKFTVGRTVLARNYRRGPKWMPGTVVDVTGPVSYLVQLTGGLLVRRHVDQLRARVLRSDSASLQQQNNTAFPEEEEDIEPVEVDCGVTQDVVGIPSQEVIVPFTSETPRSIVPVIPESAAPEIPKHSDSSTSSSRNDTEPVVDTPGVAPSPVRKQYPQRKRRPPERYK